MVLLDSSSLGSPSPCRAEADAVTRRRRVIFLSRSPEDRQSARMPSRTNGCARELKRRSGRVHLENERTTLSARSTSSRSRGHLPHSLDRPFRSRMRSSGAPLTNFERYPRLFSRYVAWTFLPAALVKQSARAHFACFRRANRPCEPFGGDRRPRCMGAPPELP